MTLPSSGPLSINQINNEFGRGRNLNAYRGTQWFTDAGSSGTFTTSNLGFNQFYGKRVDAPYRFGVGNLVFTNFGTSGVAYTTVTGGQPFALFEMYVIFTTSGQPTGNLAVAGSLDSNGNFAQTFNIIGTGPETDPYWYPAPQTNGFSLFQTNASGVYVFCNNFYATS
jgi:hypothetical protein